MAQMGYATLDELIGRSDLIEKRDAIAHWKAKGLDFGRIFTRPEVPAEIATRHIRAPGSIRLRRFWIAA